MILEEGQFKAMTTEAARKQDINPGDEEYQAWQDSLYIAQHIDSQTNPIGNRLYFLSYKPTSSKVKDILQIDDQFFFNRD